MITARTRTWPRLAPSSARDTTTSMLRCAYDYVDRRFRINVPSYPTNASGVNVSLHRPTNTSPDKM